MNVIDELYKLTEYKLFNDAKQVYVEREDVRCMLEKVINLKVAKISLNEKELTEVEKLLAKQGDIIVPCNVEISPLIQPEEQLCEDCISRRDVRNILNHKIKMPVKIWRKLFELIVCLPPVTPQQRKARWIKEETIHGWDGSSYQCSRCGRSIHIDPVVEDVNIDYPYCHCGAKMESEDKE